MMHLSDQVEEPATAMAVDDPDHERADEEARKWKEKDTYADDKTQEPDTTGRSWSQQYPQVARVSDASDTDNMHHHYSGPQLDRSESYESLNSDSQEALRPHQYRYVSVPHRHRQSPVAHDIRSTASTSIPRTDSDYASRVNLKRHGPAYDARRSWQQQWSVPSRSSSSEQSRSYASRQGSEAGWASPSLRRVRFVRDSSGTRRRSPSPKEAWGSGRYVSPARRRHRYPSSSGSDTGPYSQSGSSYLNYSSSDEDDMRYHDEEYSDESEVVSRGRSASYRSERHQGKARDYTNNHNKAHSRSSRRVHRGWDEPVGYDHEHEEQTLLSYVCPMDKRTKAPTPAPYKRVSRQDRVQPWRQRLARVGHDIVSELLVIDAAESFADEKNETIVTLFCQKNMTARETTPPNQVHWLQVPPFPRGFFFTLIHDRCWRQVTPLIADQAVDMSDIVLVLSSVSRLVNTLLLHHVVSPSVLQGFRASSLAVPSSVLSSSISLLTF